MNDRLLGLFYRFLMFLVVMCLTQRASAQLFDNLEAFGERLDAGNPAVPAVFGREGPKGLAVGDLNGNGLADLAMSNLDGTVTLYFSSGDGRFWGPKHLSMGATTLRGVIARDLTGDGILDIAAAGPFDGQVFILAGRDVGGFARRIRLRAWIGARNLAAGDFDGDGVVDLAVGGPGAGVRHYRGLGAGAFEAVVDLKELDPYASEGEEDGDSWQFEDDLPRNFPKPVYSMKVRRLPGSDRDELVVTHAWADRVWILGASPSGVLEVTGTVPLGTSSRFKGIFSLDLGAIASSATDPRARTDLVTVHRNAGTIAVRRGMAGAGRFESDVHQEIQVPGGPRAVRVLDLDGDGWNDLVVVLRNLDAIRTYRNEGGRLVPALRMPVGGSPRDAVVADFNRDGQPDVAVINRVSADVSVLTGYPERVGFAALDQLYLVDGEVARLGVVDADGDGRDDVFQVHRASGDWSLRTSGPGGRLGPPTFLAEPTFPSAQAVVDVNGDGIPDAVTTSLGRGRGGTLSVRLGDGKGGFGEARVHQLPTSVRASLSGLGVADFDLDGNVDLATAMDDCRLAMWGGTGDGRFEFKRAFFFAYEAAPRTFAAADFDQDGDIDLAAASWGGFVAVVENNGDLLRETGAAPRLRQFPYSGFRADTMKVIDFNRDGDPDLALGSDVHLSVFPGGEGISFESGTTLLDSSVSSVAVGDFDADGLRDIAVACDSESCVTILTRTSSGTYLPALTVDVPAGRYLAAGDLDGDGKDDLVGSGEVLWTALSSRRARTGAPPAVEGDRETATRPVINEILAVNRDLPVAADSGKSSDWVEIFSSEATSLLGWLLKLTRVDGSVEEFSFPAGASVGESPEMSRLLVFFSNVARSAYHTGFKLPADGATLTLVDPAGESVDVVAYPAQREDISFARYEDGLREFVFNPYPSPGGANVDNGSVSPLIRLEQVGSETAAFGDPLEVVRAGTGLRIFASGSDDVGIWSASVLYKRIDREDLAVHRAILYDDGQHQDEGVQDGLFSAVLDDGILSSGEIQFYLEAYDWSGNVVTVPEDSYLSPDGGSRNVYSVAVGVEVPSLELAEVVAAVSDGPDQLEIRNCSTAPVSLGGVSLGEQFPDEDNWFRFPAVSVLEPGEVVVVTCDGDPEDGPLHAPFKLSASGGRLVLVGSGPAGASALIDAVDYAELDQDVAWARGGCGGQWGVAEPTIGEPNSVGARRGDVDRSGALNVSDAIEILGYLFRGGRLLCPGAADVNKDESTNLADAAFLLVHLFNGGPPPEADLLPCAK